jgi:lysophospholipase L1-like esterase
MKRSIKPGRIKISCKQLSINLTFSFIIFVLFIVFLEIVLRKTHLFGARVSWAEPDSLIGYKFTPNSDYWFNKENNHPISGKINKYGWRDKNWSIEKPADTFRIAVLGDSYVEAMQVESPSTFIMLTENKLNKNNKNKFELMNFGISGATQTEELLILKNHVTNFSPDMVILFFFPGNDIADIDRETAGEKNRPFFSVSENGGLLLDASFQNSKAFRIKSKINWIKQHSILVSLFSERFNAYQLTKRMMKIKERKISIQKIPEYLSLCTKNPDAEYFKNYDLNKKLMKAAAEFCKARNIRFLLVSIATDAYIGENIRKYKDLDPSFNANFFDDDLNGYAQSLNVEYLGLQRTFNRFFENHRTFLHWDQKGDLGHWNYDGHKLVADALANKLKLIYKIELDKNLR